jgi:pilus assembly protein CpaB
VLVASKDIPIGTKVADADVAWHEWPRTASADAFITREKDPKGLTDAVGALARSTFYAGEPITDAKLIRSDRGFMSAILPAGKRAVATKIAADTSAGGFILPNDRVDVIMTRQGAAGPDGAPPQIQTESVLNNVRVLAIDQTIQEKNGEKVVVGQTATLELTPEQVQILSVAQQMSDRLTLALRSIADAEVKPSDTAADAYHLLSGNRKNGAIKVVKSGVVKEVTTIR